MSKMRVDLNIFDFKGPSFLFFLKNNYKFFFDKYFFQLGDAIVTSLAQSMKKLAEAIHNCKSRPIIKVNVMLSDDKVNKEWDKS